MADNNESEHMNPEVPAVEERIARRSAPLRSGGADYWHAVSRILRQGDNILEAHLTLAGPDGRERHLALIEDALVAGEFSEADGLMDMVRDLVICDDDDYGSAAAKSYLAGWVCADVVGRCLR